MIAGIIDNNSTETVLQFHDRLKLLKNQVGYIEENERKTALGLEVLVGQGYTDQIGSLHLITIYTTTPSLSQLLLFITCL